MKDAGIVVVSALGAVVLVGGLVYLGTRPKVLARSQVPEPLTFRQELEEMRSTLGQAEDLVDSLEAEAGVPLESRRRRRFS